MKLNIESYIGVGSIKFGMTREEVGQTVGMEGAQFFKTDKFDDFHVFYKGVPTVVCVAVELFPPGDPTFGEHHLIKRPFNEILDWVKRLDPPVEINEWGLTSYELGFAAYVPEISKGFDARVESVMVFAREYNKR